MQEGGGLAEKGTAPTVPGILQAGFKMYGDDEVDSRGTDDTPPDEYMQKHGIDYHALTPEEQDRKMYAELERRTKALYLPIHLARLIPILIIFKKDHPRQLTL